MLRVNGRRTFLAVGAVVALMVANVTAATAQATPAVGAPSIGASCQATGIVGGSPLLVCKSETVKGKKVLRWQKYVSAPPPKNLTGVRRCMWGHWRITAGAFGNYWESIAAAVTGNETSQINPDDFTDALGDVTEPIQWAGQLDAVVDQSYISLSGQVTTEGIVATSNFTAIKYAEKPKSTVRIVNGLALWTIDFGGNKTELEESAEPFDIAVSCTSNQMVWTFMVGTKPNPAIVLVRVPRA